jgi:hypothetical protein
VKTSKGSHYLTYHPFALKLLAHVSQEDNKKDVVQETTIEIEDATRLHVREKST